MVEQRVSKTRRSSRLTPFALSFIFLFVSTCCVENRGCMRWEVDKELKSERLVRRERVFKYYQTSELAMFPFHRILGAN
jgi:hypothetical protein